MIILPSSAPSLTRCGLGQVDRDGVPISEGGKCLLVEWGVEDGEACKANSRARLARLALTLH